MTDETQGEREAAAALAEAVGNLPLALEQAAAYVRQTGITLADYLKLYRETEASIASGVSDTAEYPKALATAWRNSFQRIKEESPAAADLLTLCSFLAPDDISLEIIAEGADHLPESFAPTARNAEALSRAAATLQDYALAKVRGGSFLSLHRFVQSITRNHLTEEDAKMWVEAATRLLDRAFPFDSDDARTWLVCAKLLPHSLSVIEHAASLRLVSEPLGRLLNQAGLYLDGLAEFEQAKNLYEQAIIIREKAYGADHPEVAVSLSNLGQLLSQQEMHLSDARASIERALRIDEAARGPNHPSVAIHLNNLGVVLRGQGDLEYALTCFRRALAIDEAEYGPNHSDVAVRLSNIGAVLHDKGNFAEAREQYMRALEIGEAEYGKEHPNLAIRLNNLAQVLEKQGDLQGARDHYERALKIFEKFLGEDHPNTLLVKNNLAALEKYEE